VKGRFVLAHDAPVKERLRGIQRQMRKRAFQTGGRGKKEEAVLSSFPDSDKIERKGGLATVRA